MKVSLRRNREGMRVCFLCDRERERNPSENFNILVYTLLLSVFTISSLFFHFLLMLSGSSLLWLGTMYENATEDFQKLFGALLENSLSLEYESVDNWWITFSFAVPKLAFLVFSACLAIVLYFIKYVTMSPVIALEWNEFNGFASLKFESDAAKHKWSCWGGERQWDTKSCRLIHGKHTQSAKWYKTFPLSHLIQISITLLICEALIIFSFPPSHFECSSQMTSVENIDWKRMPVWAVLKLWAHRPCKKITCCCSLGKCHYTSCLRPNAHHTTQLAAETHFSARTHTHTMTQSYIVVWFLIRCYADIPTIHSKWSHNTK